jgi:hypothetical protein
VKRLDWLPGTAYGDLDLQYDAYGNVSKNDGQALSYHGDKRFPSARRAVTRARRGTRPVDRSQRTRDPQ